MKRKPRHVVMPAKPPYFVLRAMVGFPLILSASDEALARYWYHACRNALKAKRK